MTSTGQICFGANTLMLPPMQAVVPGVHGYRIYFDDFNDIPATWPADLPPGNWATLSIRPVPDDLFNDNPVPDNGSGFTTLAGQITALAATAPAHAELTSWHEAGPGNPRNYPDYITEDAMYHLHARVHSLCSGSKVKYGSVIVGPANTRQGWLGRNLDWYGVDIYDDPSSPRYRTLGVIDPAKIAARMDANLATWQAVAGTSTPSIRIAENNSPDDTARADWFQALADWMAPNNGRRMLSFWRGGAPLSGDWPPGDAVIAKLNALQAQYGN